MSKREPLKTDQELARALDELFDEIPPPETSEEIDATLREAGCDPDEVASRMQALAERALRESPLNWRNRRQEMEQERAQLDTSSSATERSRFELLSAIRQIFTQYPQLATHHRNLDQATDDDLASLLAELEYLVRQQDTESNDEHEE